MKIKNFLGAYRARAYFLCSSKEMTPEMICVAFTGNAKMEHSGVKRLVKSCKKFDVVLQIAGRKTFSWREKVETTRECLVKMRTTGFSGLTSTEPWNGLVLVCDAFDVRLMCGADEIVQCYRELVPNADKILFTGEREPSHQTEAATAILSLPEPAVYRHFASCMLLGPRQLVARMLNDVTNAMQQNVQKIVSVAGCRCGPQPKMLCDQWYISQWVSKNPDKATIDTGCLIFWSTRGEHKNFTEKYAEASKDERTRAMRFLNRTTKTRPCVLHTPQPEKT